MSRTGSSPLATVKVFHPSRMLEGLVNARTVRNGRPLLFDDVTLTVNSRDPPLLTIGRVTDVTKTAPTPAGRFRRSCAASVSSSSPPASWPATAIRC